MKLKPGVQIAARYRVERVLVDDEGGTLLSTREAQNGLLVALKVLPSSAPEAQIISRFTRAQKIDSPHTPRLFELGGLDDGRTFVAMEYLNGTSLATRVASGPLPVGEAVKAVLQASHAVAAAHRVSVVHRRLRTSKLFEAKTTDGRSEIRVLGFATSAPPQGDLKPGELPDEIDYLAPEQLTGIMNGERSADVWALGAILYELLTGRRPFTALTKKALAKHILSDDPKPPRSIRPELPWELEQTILRCLDKAPGSRLESVEALRQALDSLAAPSTAPTAERTWVSATSPHAPPPAIPRAPLSSSSGLPDVTKLHHLLPESTGARAEPAPAFHRLRSDGHIEGMKVDDVVDLHRSRRIEEEAARLKHEAKGRAGVSIAPPARGQSLAPPPKGASSRAPDRSVPPAAKLTQQLVIALIVAAVLLGVGTGLLVRVLWR